MFVYVFLDEDGSGRVHLLSRIGSLRQGKGKKKESRNLRIFFDSLHAIAKGVSDSDTTAERVSAFMAIQVSINKAFFFFNNNLFVFLGGNY